MYPTIWIMEGVIAVDIKYHKCVSDGKQQLTTSMLILIYIMLCLKKKKVHS